MNFDTSKVQIMRTQWMPWIPAIYCSALSVITLVSDIVGKSLTGEANAGMIAFLCFLPICFFHIGGMLKRLQDENTVLRSKLEALQSVSLTERH
jgi:hypothetical protein